jgi:hypothetical protein
LRGPRRGPTFLTAIVAQMKIPMFDPYRVKQNACVRFSGGVAPGYLKLEPFGLVFVASFPDVAFVVFDFIFLEEAD